MDSYGIKGHVHLMQNRIKSKWCKYQCNTRTCFFIQITDYKNINEIFSYALKQRWKPMNTVIFQRACTAVGPNDSDACWHKETQYMHTQTRTHTLALNQSAEHQKDETKISRNNIQRASERLRASFLLSRVSGLSVIHVYSHIQLTQ